MAPSEEEFQQWRALDTGLIVPDTRNWREPKSNYVIAHMTWHLLFGQKLDISEIVELVRSVPREYWLLFTSAIGACFERRSYGDFDAQRIAASWFCNPRLLNRIHQFLDAKRFILFAPRPVLGVVKLALAFADDTATELNSYQISNVIMQVYLSVGDYIDRDVPQDVTESGDANPIQIATKLIVQNIPYGSGSDLFELLTRTWGVYCEAPEHVDFEALRLQNPALHYEGKYGLTVQEFLSIAFGFMTHYYLLSIETLNRNLSSLKLPVSDLFTKLQISIDKVGSFCASLSIDDRDIEKIKDQDCASLDYFSDYQALSQHPIYRCSDGSYLAYYLPHFRWRVTEGVYWDHLFAIPKRDRDQFFHTFGHLYQKYIETLLEKAYPTTSLTRRLWCEPKPHPSSPAADMIIRYHEALIFIEVTASKFQFMRSEIQGDSHAIQEDLHKIVYDEADQLNDAINYFFGGGLESLDLTWQVEDIYPILVTYGSVPHLQVIWDTLRDNGWLVHPKVKPLILLDASDVANMISFPLQGVSLVDVLGKKLQPQYMLMDFRTFVVEEYPSFDTTRAILTTEWENFNKTALKTLFNIDK